MNDRPRPSRTVGLLGPLRPRNALLRLQLRPPCVQDGPVCQLDTSWSGQYKWTAGLGDMDDAGAAKHTTLRPGTSKATSRGAPHTHTHTQLQACRVEVSTGYQTAPLTATGCS